MKQLRVWGYLLLALLAIPVNITAESNPSPSAEPVLLTPDSDGVYRATLVMESYTFSPNFLVVEAGKLVELTLKNESFLIPHNFVLNEPSAGLDIEETVSSGDEATVRFIPNEPGVYAFHCNKQLLFFPSHQEEGMEGRLEVR